MSGTTTGGIVIGEFLMRETGALVTHTNIVAVTLLGLGMMGVELIDAMDLLGRCCMYPR
jgi:hypothetical protein